MTTDQAAVTFYPISLFTDSSKPLQNSHRLVVIRFKEKKGSTEKKPPSYCVSIPASTISVEPEDLEKALTASLHELEDAIIRERVEEFLDDQTVRKEIASTEISATSVSLYYDRVATSGRLSKEAIEDWFNSSLAEPLAIALLQAVPALNQDADKLEKAVEGHKKHICSLASPRSMFPVKLATQLRKAVLLAPDSSETKVKDGLVKKLDIFIAATAATEMELGL